MDSDILFGYALAKNYTDKAIDNLDISGEVAEQLPSAVDDYLSEHIHPETGYVLDNSLTLENAAAQAKAVGDRIGLLADYTITEKEYYAHYTTVPPEFTEYKVDDSRGYINSAGNFNKNTGYMTLYIKVDTDGYVWYYDNLDTNFCNTAIYSALPISSSTLVGSVLNNANAPKSNNKLAISKGQYLVISRSGRGTPFLIDPFKVYYPTLEVSIDSGVKLANAQLEQAKSYVNQEVKNCLFQYRATTAADDNQIYYTDKALNVLSLKS